jgi:predicted acetyltransferase
MPPPSPSQPPRPPSGPVELVPVDRSHRAVLENLGQLYRHDLSEAYGHLPNPDGTFHNRRLDLFLAGADPEHRAWLIMVAGRLGGFVMTAPDERGGRAEPGERGGAGERGGRSVSDFFVVRALRRSGVGREAARQAIGRFPGWWSVGFQSYNPGVQRFWSQVATDAAGDQWTTYDDPPVAGRPPDSWIVFRTW